MGVLDQRFEKNFMISSVDYVFNWARKSAIWPLTFGLACCAIGDQMPDPKWCISMGACSSVGGPFNAYSVLQGVDRIVPVDVYVVGCPPRPEGLLYALLKLQDKIDQMSLAKRPTEIRLHPGMAEDFKRNVMVAQTPSPR